MFSNYTVSLTDLTYDEAHDYCRTVGDGLKLVRWDTLDKFLDVGFITGETKSTLCMVSEMELHMARPFRSGGR